MSPFPRFTERAPWWGPDLQTIRNAVHSLPVSALAPFGSKRLTIPLDDGTDDALSAMLHRPSSPKRPAVVLIHGLSGTEESAYMLATAAHLLERGHPVLRLNLRGAGASRPLCRFQYHAGRTTDLRAALRHLTRSGDVLGNDGVGTELLLVGFSLGGNMLLKFMAEHAHELPVRGAASVSAPIDLAAASRRFLEPRNRFYHWNLLRFMKIEALEGPATLSASERRSILEAGSIYEFDDAFVGPRNGYAGADEYYSENMARRFLAKIRHPTLVIHAKDDPWIPSEAYTSYPWDENPSLIPLLPSGGGHVGFHGRGSRTTWHDRCLGIFFDSLEHQGANASSSN